MDFRPFDVCATDLGLPALDEEHRGQIELMNELGAAIAAKRAPAEISLALDRLTGYLDAHFMSEQIAMRERAYPEYDAHRMEHDAAIDMLRELGARGASGDATTLLRILRALDEWLVVHVRTSDAAYARFVLAPPAEVRVPDGAGRAEGWGGGLTPGDQ